MVTAFYVSIMGRGLTKCKCGLAALKTMVITYMEQRLLFLLFSHLVLSVSDYGPGVLTLNTVYYLV